MCVCVCVCVLKTLKNNIVLLYIPIQRVIVYLSQTVQARGELSHTTIIPHVFPHTYVAF